MISHVKKLEQFLPPLPISFWAHKMMDLPLLLRWARIPKNSKVLEIGCHEGRLSLYLAEKLKCRNYTGIDIDASVIAKAEARTKDNTKVIFQVADVLRLPFEDESFDAIIEMNVLHHLPNWKKALKEIHRVLKKNGKFVMRDYTIESFNFPGIGLLLRYFVEHPYNHMFDQVELLTFLRKNGFNLINQGDTSLVTLLVAQKDSKK